MEQKLPGFGGVVSILGCPPAKLETTDYYPVINTHITDSKAAHECPRHSEDGAQDVGQIQGHLNNILGPGKAMYWGPTHTTTHRHRNKTVSVDHVKYIFIVLVLPTKSVFKQ